MKRERIQKTLSQKCLEFIHTLFLSFLFSGPSTYFIFLQFTHLFFFNGPSTFYPRPLTFYLRPSTETQTPLHSLQKMAYPMLTLNSLLRKAVDGNKDALQFFALDRGFNYECPPTFTTATEARQDLEKALLDTIIFAEAANWLHLKATEKVAQIAITHMSHTLIYRFRPA